MENQKSFFSDFAKKNNFQLMKIYADEGISGKQMKNRTAFLQLLEDAKLNIFDMVVVKDISRFARNTVDFLNSIRSLKSLGIEVKFLSSNQTILGDSEFILTIFSAMAQEESANLSKRVKFGKKINAQKGRVPARIYGYNRIDNFTLIPDEHEANIVKRIYYMYTSIGYGAAKIAKVLTDENVPTKLRADGWTSKTIRRILSNPIYVGKYINNKYEVKDYLTGERGVLPPSQHIIHERPEYRIINDEIFNAAQEKMDSKRKLYKTDYVHMQGRDSTRHIFSTLIRCEKCGYSFSRKSYTYKSTRTYWVCTGFNIRGSNYCNNNTYIEEADLIEFIRNYFENLIEDKDKFVEKIKAELDIANSKDINKNKFDKKKTEALIKKANDEKDKYKNMYINNIIDIDELKSKIKILDTKIKELEDTIYDAEISLKRNVNLNEKTKELYFEISNILTINNWTNIELKKIIDKITVNEEGIVTILLKELR